MTRLELVAGWLQSLRRRHLAAGTLKSYGTTVRAYLLDVDPLTVTVEGVEAWLDTKRLKARSRLCYIAALGSFHAWLVDRDLRSDDPTARVVRPRLPRRMPRPIAGRDLERALVDAPPRMRLWLCLAAYGGLRCCEIAGLRVEDIDLEDDPPMLRLRTTKGDKPRGVPLAPVTLEALAAVELPSSGLAFASRSDDPVMAARYVSDEINGYLDRCGIDATAHQLRHYFGTEVYRGTQDLRLVQDLLGHADISTTAGYVALVPSPAAVEAVRALGAVGPHS